MPKFSLASRGRIHIPEEYGQMSEEEEPLMQPRRKKQKGTVVESGDEWERVRNVSVECENALKLF